MSSLASLTVVELRARLDEQGVDRKGCKRKADLISRLEEHELAVAESATVPKLEKMSDDELVEEEKVKAGPGRPDEESSTTIQTPDDQYITQYSAAAFRCLCGNTECGVELDIPRGAELDEELCAYVQCPACNTVCKVTCPCPTRAPVVAQLVHPSGYRAAAAAGSSSGGGGADVAKEEAATQNTVAAANADDNNQANGRTGVQKAQSSAGAGPSSSPTQPKTKKAKKSAAASSTQSPKPKPAKKPPKPKPMTPGRKICMTTAMQRYALTKEQLLTLPHDVSDNPHNSYTVMRRFGSNLVHALALSIHGSEQGIERAKNKRTTRGAQMKATRDANRPVREATLKKQVAAEADRMRQQRKSAVGASQSSRARGGGQSDGKCSRCRNNAPAAACTSGMCGNCCRTQKAPCRRHKK